MELNAPLCYNIPRSTIFPQNFHAIVIGYTSTASETALFPVARLILRVAIEIPRRPTV